jgi:hypothetical protein
MSKTTQNSPVNRAIDRPILSKSLLATLINTACVAVLGCVFYFGISRPIAMTLPSYQSSVQIRDEKENKYDLKEKEGQSFETYQKPVESFYFDAFPTEIKNLYDSLSTEKSSLAYYYNVNVCRLPTDPSPTSYKTDFFSYVLNEDGSVNKDVKARCLSAKLNETGLKNLSDLYWSSYEKLPSFLRDIDGSYKAATDSLQLYEGFGRMISLGMAFLIIELFVPLFGKFGQEPGERILRLGFATKAGFLLPKWRLPLKALLYLVIPTLGSFYFNAYTVVLLWVAPLAANLLFLLFSSRNQTLPDLITGLIEVDLKTSEVYKDAQEKEDSEKMALGYFDDPAYVDLLSKADQTKKDEDD